MTIDAIRATPLTFDAAERATPVTAAERALLSAVKTGDGAEIQDAPGPDSETGWTDDHVIRADFLRHLCLYPDRYDMDPRGIGLKGVWITGAWNLQAVHLAYPVTIIRARFDTPPVLTDAVTRTFTLHGCRLPGLGADRLRVTGRLGLAECTIEGETRLLGAGVTGNIECSGATFTNPDDDALSADSLTVGGKLILDSVTATGETRLVGAHVTGNVDCESADFTNAGGDTFSADRLKVGGSLCLKGVTATGETRLLGASVTGTVACNNATFNNPEKDTFSADRLKVGGSLFLKGVTATGETRLLGANVTGNVDCEDATFTNPIGDAVNAQRLRVGARLFWRNFATPPEGEVKFAHARVGELVDDGTGWPAAGKLYLDGFRYESLGLPPETHKLCTWLGRMPDTFDDKPVFWAQPYEHLVKVLREAGHDDTARDIAMAKQDARRVYLRRTTTGWWDYKRLMGRFGLCALKLTAGYGYRPGRAIIGAMLFIVTGTVLFEAAQIQGHIRPAEQLAYMNACYGKDQSLVTDDCRGVWRVYSTERRYADHLPATWRRGLDGMSVTYRLPEDYVTFHALAYSVDVFVPILNLGQEPAWAPKEGLARAYMWVHIIMGWVLTTIAVAGFSGLIKQD